MDEDNLRLLAEQQEQNAERQQTDAALLASEQRFRALIEHSFDAVALFDRDGIALYSSPSTLRITGRASDELTGQSAFQRIHPNDLPRLKKFLADLLENPRLTLQFQFRYRHQNESWIWLDATATNLLDQPAVQAIVVNYRDITERRRAEKESQRFGQILDDSLNEIYTFDATALHFVRVNVGAQHNLGYAMEELRRLTPLDLMPEFSRRSFEALIEPLLAGWKGRTVFQTVHRRKNGSTYPVEVHLQLANGSESPMFVAIIQDITERQRAEEALRESEARYRLLADNTDDFVLLNDTQGNRLYVSPSYFRVTGLTLEEMQRTDWRTRLHPDDLPLIERTRAANLAGESTVIEHRVRCKDGSWIWGELHCKPLTGPDGRVSQILLSSRDITARKRAQEALRESQAKLELVLDSIPQGVFWKDRDSVYCGANCVARRAMGFKDSQSVAGQTDFDIPTFQREQAEFFVQKDREVMQSDQPQFGIIETMTLPNGTTIWLETNKMPMHDATGNVTGILGTWQDITERRQFNEELAASRERLQILSRQLIATQESERRHLARELHDEIGQSLTGIKLNLKALRQSPRTPNSETLIADTIAVVEQTLQQVRGLSLDLRPSMLDDIGLVAALRWCLDRQATLAGFVATLVADADDGHVDPDIAIACFRVAQESLTNIARHAHAHKVRIELHHRESELELLVHDDGCGFDVAAARARAARGGSLGLLGMEERVLIIGGKIRITSSPSDGTTINAWFPLHDAATVMEESP